MSRINFISSSNDVINLKIVRSEKDIGNGNTFKPSFTHQVFGDDESIFGYAGLEVNLIYSASKLNCLLTINYDKLISSDDGQKPEDIFKKLTSVIRHEIFTDRGLFLTALEKEDDFLPYGSLVKSFSLNHNNENHNYEVYVCDPSTEGFINYLERVETFLIWFIDAASYVDNNDPRWQFFLLYEKMPSLSEKYQFSYSFVGYISVYSYYAYPDQIRPRISQVLILPPFQNRGLCAHLLNSLYYHFVGERNIRDITVEAPNPAFQSVRDYVDCTKCSKLSSFSEANLVNGFSKNMAEEAQQKLKFTSKQVRRIFDILYLKNIVGSNEDKYSAFMDEIKRRLIIKSHLCDPEMNGETPRKKRKLIPTSFELSEEAEAEIYELVKETMFQYKNVIRRLIKFPADF